jgi:membrane-associated phospholipid phosphatase
VDAALLAGAAAVTAAVFGPSLGADLAVRDWVDAHRPPPADLLARGLNYLGQGTPLTLLALGLAALLAWRRRTVRPLLPVAAAFALTYLTVGPLKLVFDRAAPHTFAIPHPERFFSGGVSFPSGHAVNAIVWYGVLALLLGGALPDRWRTALRVVPPVVVCVVTTYTGFHWLTDTVTGLLLGLVLDRLLRRVPWRLGDRA